MGSGNLRTIGLTKKMNFISIFQLLVNQLCQFIHLSIATVLEGGLVRVLFGLINCIMAAAQCQILPDREGAHAHV
jgi:hypothetical protein